MNYYDADQGPSLDPMQDSFLAMFEVRASPLSLALSLSLSRALSLSRSLFLLSLSLTLSLSRRRELALLHSIYTAAYQ